MTSGQPPGLQPGLQLQGLSKRLGGHAVIQDLSLTARAGELLTLVGPSGSGKKIGRASCRERV